MEEEKNFGQSAPNDQDLKKNSQTHEGEHKMTEENNKQYQEEKNDHEKETEKNQASSNTNENDGELTYDDNVIQKIIALALKEVDGLLTVDGGFFKNAAEKLVNTDNDASGINTEVGKKQVAVDMDVVVEYGKDVNEIFQKMKKLVKEEVKNMTGLDVIEVNMNVTDIKTREEFEKDSETVQDKVEDAAETTKEKANEAGDKVSEKADEAKDAAEEKKEEDDSRVE